MTLSGFFRSAIIFLSLFLASYTLIKAQSTNNFLVIEGNILGYKSYKIKPITLPMLQPILVKITKIVEGEEKSEYVKVLAHSLNENSIKEILGYDKSSIFKLKRYNFCDVKLSSFTKSEEYTKIGNTKELYWTFTMAYDVKTELLPLKKRIPCYIESFEK